MLITFITAITVSIFASGAGPNLASTPQPDWKYVEQQLKAHKFKKSFIQAMKSKYDTQDFSEVLELNVLLFLRKSDYHGPQISGDSAIEVRDFISKHRKTLDLAEQKFQVPAEVVVSLIWLESRLGRNKGSFHVPSVYLHLLQADRKPIVAYLKTRTGRFADKVTKKQFGDIAARAKRKFDFALGELRAIAKIYEWKWEFGTNFTGSFAGAFGMPQFIPSSYVKWARPFTLGEQPQLSQPDDAILSVAYYLKDHGWQSAQKKKRVEALMKYNNSRDYAFAILDLAKRAKELKVIASSENSDSARPATANSENDAAIATKPDKLRERVKGDAFTP